MRLFGKSTKDSTSPKANKGSSHPPSAKNSLGGGGNKRSQEVHENLFKAAHLPPSSSSTTSLASIAEEKHPKNQDAKSSSDKYRDDKAQKSTTAIENLINPEEDVATEVRPSNTSQPIIHDDPHDTLIDHETPAAHRHQVNANLGWYNFFAPLFCLAPTSSIDDDDTADDDDENNPCSLIRTKSRKLNAITFLGETKFHMMVDEAIDRAKVYLGLKKSDLPFKWKLKSKADGIEVHSCYLPNDTACVVRSHFNIDCSIAMMKELLLTEKYFPTLDPSLEKFENLEIPSCTDTIARRYCYKSYFPLAPRDFVALTSCLALDSNMTIIATVSLPNEFYPKSGSYVRGEVIITCSLLKKVDENQTEVTMINHCHLEAFIPMYAVNQAAVNIPNHYVAALRKEATSIK